MQDTNKHSLIIKKRTMTFILCLFFCLIINAPFNAHHIRATLVRGHFQALALWVNRSDIAALHGSLQFFVRKQLLKLHQVHHVLVIIQRRVVLHSLVVERDKMLCRLAVARLFQLSFVLSDRRQQPVDLQVFYRVATNFALQQQPLLFKFFLDLDPLALEVFHNQRDAFI